MIANRNQTYVYWEQQGIDQLCGVHTLNSLLQGPYFNEIQLAEIALNLDQQEHQLMGGRQQGKSHNVADDGNYSIQVLQECLKTLNLNIESVESKINKNEDMIKEQGFICNSSNHWFAIRKVNGAWYNLNSCSVYGPQPINDFYVSQFLMSVRDNGFSIFVVKGKYPDQGKSSWPNLAKYQRFLTPETIKKYAELEQKQSNGGAFNIGGYQNQESMAIEESKRLADLQRNQEMAELDEKKQIEAFSGKATSLQNDDTFIDYHNFHNFSVDTNEDPELAFAMQQSLKSTLAEKFSMQPTEGNTIRFIHPNGEKSTWTFAENSLIEEMYDYAFFKIPDGQTYKFFLTQTHPQRKFTNLKQTLVEADIDDMDTIYISKQ